MYKNVLSLQSLIAQAEDLALEMQANRSQLDSQALNQHLQRRDPTSITEALNRVYLVRSSYLHRTWRRLQIASGIQ